MVEIIKLDDLKDLVLHRRKFIAGVGILCVAEAVLEPLGYGLLSSGLVERVNSCLERRFRDPIGLKEYERICQILTDHGLEIDCEHSRFINGSKSLILYLPDLHRERYAERQRSRIQQADSLVRFDVIGLEGLVGKIDEDVREKSRQFKEELKKICFDPYVYSGREISQSDSGIIVLKKLWANINISHFRRVKKINALLTADEHIFYGIEDGDSIDQIISKYANKKISENEETLDERERRFLNYLDLVDDVSQITHHLLPDREDPFLPRLLGEYHLETVFLDSVPCQCAPGLLYLDVSTNAEKTGMEELPVLRRAYNLRLTIDVKYCMIETRKVLDRVKQGFNDFMRSYVDATESAEEFMECESVFRKCVDATRAYFCKMQETYDLLFERLSDEERDAINEADELSAPDSNIDLDFEDLKIYEITERIRVRERSMSWINTLMRYRMSMLIGGMGHTASVYDYAMDRKVSLISLTFLE